MELVLLVGPPGSGKSTHALACFPNHVRISQDDQGKAHLNLFNNALTQGLDIVVDRMNHTKAQRDRYLGPAKEKGYTIKIIVIHENYATCFDRASARENHPSIKNKVQAAKALTHFFKNYERVQDSEANQVTRHWPSVSSNVIVCDLDGTLADCTHRLHHVKSTPKNWKAFFEGIPHDTVYEWCKESITRASVPIIICTARPSEYGPASAEWLSRMCVPYQEMFMRQNGDHRADNIVKEILLEFEIKTRYNILMWLDDSPAVVKMLRDHNITVLDCGQPTRAHS